MSATLIAVIPLALLGMVALLGFVGCGQPFTVGPGPETHTDLYDEMMKNEANLVAFWTLTEGTGAAKAKDQKNGFDGDYKSGLGMTNYDGANKSAGAAGDVTPGQAGIVPGDALDGVKDSSAFFNGGVVSVTWDPVINRDPPFTVEAWVLPGWKQTDVDTQPALRGVVVSNNIIDNEGFGLFATELNFWSFAVGIDDGSMKGKLVQVTSDSPIVFSSTADHVVATLDINGLCTLYVNGNQVKQTDTSVMGKYKKLMSSTPPLFVGAGRPDQQLMQPPPPPPFPLVGNVQCVAIYKEALGSGAVQTHYSTGKGP